MYKAYIFVVRNVSDDVVIFAVAFAGKIAVAFVLQMLCGLLLCMLLHLLWRML